MLDFPAELVPIIKVSGSTQSWADSKLFQFFNKRLLIIIEIIQYAKLTLFFEIYNFKHYHISLSFFDIEMISYAISSEHGLM